MGLITAEQCLDRERGSAVVCIPAVMNSARGPAEDLALASSQSVLDHTDASTPILITGTSTLLKSISAGLSRTQGREIVELALGPTVTEVQAVNAAASVSLAADLVLVTPGVRVTPTWLERLQAAARHDSTIASATPLSRGAGGLELADRETLSFVGMPEMVNDIDEAARAIAERGLRLRPRIATVGTGCSYLRRTALELAGPLEESLPLDWALADWALRTIAVGMVHVLCDDVLVEGRCEQPTAYTQEASPPSVRIDGELRDVILNEEHGPLRRSLERTRAALQPLSVTIDGRSLVDRVGGTQTYLIGLILALADKRAVALRVLTPPDLSDRAADAFATVPHVELVAYEQAVRDPRPTHVVHRPQQVFTRDDFDLLRLLGERIVIGHQDLIAYHNQAYHPDIDSWQAYRRATRLTLGGVDQVVFFSEHARQDALAEDLVCEARTHVVGIGADGNEPAGANASLPGGREIDSPFLLCLSADYLHKNRPFAIELLRELRELGWGGRLVLAGAHVPHGSSREREEHLLAEYPQLAAFVVDLGEVDESGKRWLFAHARGLVYPTVYEGFGLLPLEASRAGLPCFFAAQASLSEIAPDTATLVPWDARASAVAVLGLLSDGPARENHIARLRSLAIPDWSEVTEQLVGIYEHALASPPLVAGPRSWQDVDRELQIAGLEQDVSQLRPMAQEYQEAYYTLESRVSKGLPLIDDGGLLSDAQQRGLMRVAARQRLGALVLAPFGLLGRLGSDSGDGRR